MHEAFAGNHKCLLTPIAADDLKGLEVEPPEVKTDGRYMCDRVDQLPWDFHIIVGIVETHPPETRTTQLQPRNRAFETFLKSFRLQLNELLWYFGGLHGDSTFGTLRFFQLEGFEELTCKKNWTSARFCERHQNPEGKKC